MSKTTQIRQQTWTAPVAAANTGILAAQTLPASGTTTVTSGFSTPDYPRTVRIKGNATGISGNVVVTGTDILDQTVTDTIAANGSSAVDGAVAFKTITSAVFPTRNASGDTISIGPGPALGLDCYIDANSFRGFSGVSSSTNDATAISKNTVTLSASLDGSTNQALNYVPATFPTYNRIYG